jgi:multicomponent Na+:H+ antiporter subunit E
MTLESASARVFFVNLVSLVPGTLSADIRGDRLLVHTLGSSQDTATELGRMERYVAEIFGGSIPQAGVEGS